MNHITDVFFDLDHTLWDFDKNSKLTFELIFKQNQIDIDIEAFLKHYKPININYWKLYREDKIDKETLRFGRFNDTFVKLNIEVSKIIVHKLSDDFMTYLTSFNHLFTNTIEILNYLKPKLIYTL